jgi:hypothetical protein
MKHVALVTCNALLIINSSLFSQETTGNIEGWVFDATGKPVVGASVVVTSLVLQGTRGGPTDERGWFRILVLPPGSYSVRIAHVSLKSATIDSVRVFLGRTTSVGQLRLEERNVEIPMVVVNGSRPLIDPRSTTSGINLTDVQFQVLPVDRGYITMLQLAPQSTPSFYGDGINVAGATGIENRYFLNGAEVTDAFRGFGATQLPYNFIREVQVRSGAYEAEYQSSLGGTVNVVTYSGGNEVHGQAFGFYTNNRFSGSPRMALGKPPQAEFSEYDVGLSVGGPIVRDRLWYFLAYNPRFVKEVVSVSGQPDQTDQATTHMFASKVTWRINESNELALSIIGDPTTRRGVGVNLMGPMPPYVVTDLNAWLSNIHTGGVSVVASGTHTVGSNLILESSFSMVTRQEEYDPAGHSGPYFFIDYASNSIGGTLDRTFETTTQMHGGLRATFAIGNHTLKSGVEYVESAYESQDVWQDIAKYSDSEYWLLYRDFAGSVRTRNPSLYVQDSWQLSERFCVNAGIRWDPQFMIASDGTVAQEILGGVAPRLGIIYQPGITGSQKITAFLGRFYQPVSLSLPSAYHIKRVNTFDVFYPQDPRVDTVGSVRYPGVFSFVGNVNGLEGQYYDEVTLGYENEISPGLRAGIKGSYRGFGQGIEDSWSNDESRMLYGNPGSPPLENFPKVKRQHTSLELTVDRMDPTGLSFQVAYVLSRNYGNYEGLADATYMSSTAGLEIFPNTSFAFHSPDMMNNAQGLLPDDRTHTFKFFASYAFASGLAVGASGFWVSGTPLSEFGTGLPPFKFPVFLQRRGSMGRTPSIWDLNLRLVYDIADAVQTTWHPRLIVDVLHLFGQKKAAQIDQQHYLNADADGNQLDSNPNYGVPFQFQPPMSLRLGMEVDF